MRNTAYTLLLLVSGALASCGTRSSGLAGRVNNEVRDKYLKTFNDPQSYEVVENKYDSVGYTAYRRSLLAGIRQNDKAIKENTALIIKSENVKGLGAIGLVYGMQRAQELFNQLMEERRGYVQARSEAKKYRADFVRDTVALARLKLTSKDVYLVRVKHIYRAKNTAGALQRGAFDFDYFPKRDSLVMVANNPEYTEGAAAN